MASSGRYGDIEDATHRRVPFGAYKIGLVASSREHKFLTNDVGNDPRIHDREWARELDLVSFAGYQIRLPGGETLFGCWRFSAGIQLPRRKIRCWMP